jgi:hypothetical protein
MDPADAIRLAADARPDAPPAELATILGTYGVTGRPRRGRPGPRPEPAEYEVHRPDAADAPQVSELEPSSAQGAVVEAASILGPDASARDIAAHLARHRRLVVDRAVHPHRPLAGREEGPSRSPRPTPMEGGYA